MVVDRTMGLEVPLEEEEESPRPSLVVLEVVQFVQVSLMVVVVQLLEEGGGAASLLCSPHQVQSAL